RGIGRAATRQGEIVGEIVLAAHEGATIGPLFQPQVDSGEWQRRDVVGDFDASSDEALRMVGQDARGRVAAELVGECRTVQHAGNASNELVPFGFRPYYK